MNKQFVYFAPIKPVRFYSLDKTSMSKYGISTSANYDDYIFNFYYPDKPDEKLEVIKVKGGFMEFRTTACKNSDSIKKIIIALENDLATEIVDEFSYQYGNFKSQEEKHNFQRNDNFFKDYLSDENFYSYLLISIAQGKSTFKTAIYQKKYFIAKKILVDRPYLLKAENKDILLKIINRSYRLKKLNLKSDSDSSMIKQVIRNDIKELKNFES